MAGNLYLVATPIGNLEDITFRAVKILNQVDLIAAEDTRRTKILNQRYQIPTPLTSYHRFNLQTKTPYLLSLLKAGKNLALVSDAGMPGISDPGYELVREAIKEGIKVEPIPGSSAVITALAVSGLPTERFVFEGFLPRKKGKRIKVLEGLKDEKRTIIIYESPYRLMKTLVEIKEILGEREIAICRELTKQFEEIIRGKISPVWEQLKGKKIKGEIVLVLK